MKRRSFIGFLGAAAAWPLTARAQQATAKRVGVLMGVSENSETRTWISAFRSGLQALRWVEDADVKIEIRWASGDIGLMRSLASELIEWRADVVLTHATPATVALSEKTRTLQNVFVGAGDPVGSGFVENIHRPG